ncbi:TPA: replication initiation factor domain-containing protein [Photobacterium damselae]|uniref:Replication initiation factor domain-containing protein n=1 Tax=Photobacterium damselae subsp. damselae TaxID=85581 RepID=A0A850R7I0_PHODD|nr:replication initiation factor domain-containing protein [Photobacterium damselae subsp. damselae]
MTAINITNEAQNVPDGRYVFIDWLRFTAPLFAMNHLDRANSKGIDFDDNFAVFRLPKPDYKHCKGDARQKRIEIYQQRYREALIIRLKDFCRLCLGFECSPFCRGRNGYTDGFKIMTPDGLTAGDVSFGGNNDTFCIDITGTGCSYLFDNQRRSEHDARYMTPEILHFWLSEVLSISRIKRVDFACDFRDGSVVVDDARKAYKVGAFRRSTGRYPSFTDIQKGDENGVLTGDTFYVGTRVSSVMWRVYNKALQLGVDTDWTRAEVQLNDCSVDVLLNIGGTYTGLCEFAQSICPAQPVSMPAFDQVKKASAHILSKTRWLRNQVSKTMHGLLEYFQGDLSAVFGVMMRQDDIDNLVMHEVLDRYSVSPTALRLNNFVNAYA